MAVNVMVPDMDIAARNPRDGRRFEIVVHGLPLFGGAQFAVDITLVSALHCGGSATAGARDNGGAALVRVGRRKERTYPNWSVVEHGLGWSCWRARSPGGGQRDTSFYPSAGTSTHPERDHVDETAS